MPAANSYYKVKEHINFLAKVCGRHPSDITLIAVSKKKLWSDIFSVYQAGCRDFGENQVQEVLPKIQIAPQDIHWHLIGTLQKNKVKKIIGKFDLIHSIDSFSLAEKISIYSEKENITTKILLQVNTSGEKTKHGLSQKEWLRFIPNLVALPNISVEGLMTIAPETHDSSIVRSCFRQLRLFRDELNHSGYFSHSLSHLSMGMTNDYPIAIQEGATHVRVGSAIFGERE